MGRMSDIHLEAHQLAEEEAFNAGINEHERQNYVEERWQTIANELMEKYANAARVVR